MISSWTSSRYVSIVLLLYIFSLFVMRGLQYQEQMAQFCEILPSCCLSENLTIIEVFLKTTALFLQFFTSLSSIASNLLLFKALRFSVHRDYEHTVGPS
jgi:hypothetical protein